MKRIYLQAYEQSHFHIYNIKVRITYCAKLLHHMWKRNGYDLQKHSYYINKI